MIGIDSVLFTGAREDFENSLNGLLNFMTERRLLSGSITLKCSIEMVNQNAVDPETGETIIVTTPAIEHKVSIGTSASHSVKGFFKNEKKGIRQNDKGEFEIYEIFDGQTSMFDESKEEEEPDGDT